jgi:aspartyl-tRNA(Asn)/glutamyl-tRNA(Gln) amidotransferase subunit C
MKIELKDVNKIAELARLGLNDDEKLKYLGDLNRILDYVDMLNKIDTDNLEPLVSVMDKKNTPMRKDIVGKSLSQAEALKNAPDANSDYFKVPKVL